MNAPSVDIANLLEDLSIGAIGTNIHVANMPDSPNVCIAVYDTGGFAPQSNYKYDFPTVQVIIRGAVGGYLDAYAKAESIKNALHDLHNASIGAAWYIAIWAMGDILFIGTDEKNRPKLSCNFRIHRTD